jgi:hypothetical protein
MRFDRARLQRHHPDGVVEIERANARLFRFAGISRLPESFPLVDGHEQHQAATERVRACRHGLEVAFAAAIARVDAILLLIVASFGIRRVHQSRAATDLK